MEIHKPCFFAEKEGALWTKLSSPKGSPWERGLATAQKIAIAASELEGISEIDRLVKRCDLVKTIFSFSQDTKKKVEFGWGKKGYTQALPILPVRPASRFLFWALLVLEPRL